MLASGGLLLAGVALLLFTRAGVVRVRRGHRHVTLHPVEVGYLVGGPEHAVLVAAVALHDAGVLRPTPAPRLQAPTGSRPEGVRLTREEVMRFAPSGCSADATAIPDHPLEQAVVRSVAAEPGRPAANKALQRSPEMTELHDDLASLGLIVDRPTAWLVRLSGLWPVIVVGLGVLWLGTGPDGVATWASVGALATSIVGIGWKVPDQAPAARRAVERAATHRQDLAETLTKRIDGAGFGTDNPQLRAAGADPLVVAAHGPVVLWSAQPLLAVALGTTPSPRHLRRGRLVNAPLHHSPYVDYAVVSTGGLP